MSELQESEIFYQHPNNVKYQFSLKCASDGSSLYEFSHYDFNKHSESNNLEEFHSLEKQKETWRINKFNSRIEDFKDSKANVYTIS